MVPPEAAGLMGNWDKADRQVTLWKGKSDPPTPVLPVRLPVWTENGNCSSPGVDPEIFFEGIPYLKARKVCSSCPIKKECLEYALKAEAAEGFFYGFWGGHDPQEREAILRGERECPKAVIPDPVAPWHGTIRGYIHNKCRCPRCAEAYSTYRKKWRADRKAAATTDGDK